jgi:Family of unknown function (DUF6459)
MTRTALQVQVLPELPDRPAAADASPGTSVTAPTDGATALDPDPDRPSAKPSEPATGLRLLPGGGSGTGVDEDHQRALMRARRFIQAIVEIVSGDRPCTQLVRWTEREVYESLTTRVAALSGVTGSVPPTERPRAKVVSVKVCRPRDGVAEVAAHVRQGRRSHALAARLEQSDRRWICTALELG